MVNCSTCGLPVDQEGVCPQGHPYCTETASAGTSSPNATTSPASTPQPHHRHLNTAVVGAQCNICHAPNDECGTCNNGHTTYDQVYTTI